MQTCLSKSAKFQNTTGEASKTPTLSVGVALFRGRARPSLDSGHCQWPTCFLWVSQTRKPPLMHILWLILKIIIIFLVLKLILVQLNNWLFTIWRKPYLCGMISEYAVFFPVWRDLTILYKKQLFRVDLS